MSTSPTGYEISDLPTLRDMTQPALGRLPASAIPQFLQKLPAGFPSPAADHLEQGLDFNNYLVHRKAATFVFTVSGDSMKNIGIFDGDKVVVDRSVEPKHRDIVVAIVNNEHTLKRLWNTGGVVELRAENPAYRTITFREEDTLNIFGVVIGVVRRLRG
jgi:DNA polymerase V